MNNRLFFETNYLKKAYRLVKEALNAKQAEADNKNTSESRKKILAQAESMLGLHFSPSREVSKEDAEFVAKICLALSYIKTDWKECSDFLKLILTSSINCYCPKMTAIDAKCVLHMLAHAGFPKNWSSTVAGLTQQSVSYSLLQVIHNKIDSCDQQVQANILWDIAKLDLDINVIEPICIAIFNKILTSINTENNLDQYNDFELKQINYFLACYQSKISSEALTAIRPLFDTCTLRLNDNSSDTPQSSRMHLEILKIMRNVASIPLETEFPVAGFYADICFSTRNIIIEVNGPHHYDNQGKLNFRSISKQQALEKCGYKVYHIHYKDWINAKNKKEFIRDLLASAHIPHYKVSSDLTVSIENDLSHIPHFDNKSLSIKITILNTDESNNKNKRPFESQEDGSWNADNDEPARKYPRY